MVNKQDTVNSNELAVFFYEVLFYYILLSKLKNTVDTIYKVSNKSKILEFFTKNHNTKTQDIKNLISNRHYFDTTRQYEENIMSEVRDIFQEELSRTNRVYRTDTDYSINQRIIKVFNKIILL